MASEWEMDTEQMPIVKARAMLTQLPEILSEESRALALTRHGKPVLALMPWDLFMSIIDTVEIMGDPELMASLRSGIRDLQEGNVASIDEVKAELGISD
ncbi:MAG: type II toxin-antitoxin system Phd/YefM family antitoxin [Chloroflexota bacterium]|nr:type II toxin-antitoxin system Phd/YefM family antitoxin [Chloroflexota bacterium]MDE2684470.1 type II toxin-antitoxin system Phd/YefM family antitoxin [Chloroflexota bacterium]